MEAAGTEPDTPARSIGRTSQRAERSQLHEAFGFQDHLRIKAFYGASENAVKTQIWIALSVYVLVAIVRKRLGLDGSFYKLLQVLSLTLFEKMPISTAVFDTGSQFEDMDAGNQLQLFNL